MFRSEKPDCRVVSFSCLSTTHVRQLSTSQIMSSKSDAESMPPPPPSLPKTPSGSPAKRPPHQQQSHQPRRSVSTKPAETPAVGEASAEAKQAQRMSQLERKVARLENELLGQLQYNFRMEQLEKEVRVVGGVGGPNKTRLRAGLICSVASNRFRA